MFTRFTVGPHYAYLKLKMPGPRGVITINGNTEHPLRPKEYTTAITAEVQSGLVKPHNLSTIKPLASTTQDRSIFKLN